MRISDWSSDVCSSDLPTPAPGEAMRVFGRCRRIAMRQKINRRARGEAGEAPAEPRTNLYDEVTNRIIAELEGGRIPWVQPWGSVGTATPGLPRNAVTGRAYSGVNVLILWGALFEHGFPSQGWLTFKQARDAGAASARASMA